MLLLRANRLVLASTLLTQAYSVVGSALAPVIRPRATVCNGHAQFCSRSYGNVSYVGAHDSYAIGVNLRKSTSTKPLLFFVIAERLSYHIVAANQDQNGTSCKRAFCLRFSTTFFSHAAVE